jgi:hypothetical protein
MVGPRRSKTSTVIVQSVWRLRVIGFALLLLAVNLALFPLAFITHVVGIMVAGGAGGVPASISGLGVALLLVTGLTLLSALILPQRRLYVNQDSHD